MKKIYVSICLLFLSPNLLFATHNKGGEITFTVLNVATRTFQITITTYTKLCPVCPDRDFLDSVYFGDSGIPVSVPRHDFLDVGDSTRINHYIVNHSYPSNGDYIISFTDPNRNEGIVNIPNSVNIPFCTQSTIKLIPAFGANNSVQFAAPPIFKGEINRLYRTNPIAIDPDGDSVSFQLTTPRSAPNTYVAGYTLPNGITLNAISGEIQWNTFASPGVGDYTFAIQVIEWRCGHPMDTVIRDFQISLIATASDTMNVFAPLALSQDASGNYFTSVNPGDTVNIHAVYYYSAVGSIAAYGEAFSLANPPVVQLSTGPGTRIADLSWIPDSTNSLVRPYVFTFRGSSTISNNRQSDLTFLVYVNGPDSSCYAGVDELPGNTNTLSIFPNPATDELVVNSSEFRDKALLEIYDVLSQCVFSQHPDARSQQLLINISSLKPGIYFVKVKTDMGSSVGKFVKE